MTPHLKISTNLIQELKQTKNPFQLNRTITHLQRVLESGYDPTDMNYFLFNQLIGIEGIPKSVLYPFLKSLIQHKNFQLKQDNTHMPTMLMGYLAGHSYWLDKDLFDFKIISKKRKTSHMSSGEKNLMDLLDIGCILLNKGFQFPNPTSFQNPEITPYMQTYIRMVHQRHQYFFLPHRHTQISI